MASRVGLVAALVLVSAVVATSTAARQPPTGTAIYVVRVDKRLCPSPLCGGYWVAHRERRSYALCERTPVSAVLRRASGRLRG